jgi:hypothetical protein
MALASTAHDAAEACGHMSVCLLVRWASYTLHTHPTQPHTPAHVWCDTTTYSSQPVAHNVCLLSAAGTTLGTSQGWM